MACTPSSTAKIETPTTPAEVAMSSTRSAKIADSTPNNIWHVQHEDDEAEDEDVVTVDEGHGDERDLEHQELLNMVSGATTGEWSSHQPLAKEANTPAME